MTQIASTDLLDAALAALALLTGFVALLRFARNDAFAGPGTGYQPHDELGPLTSRRRPA